MIVLAHFKSSLLLLFGCLFLSLTGCGGGSSSGSPGPPPPTSTNINISFANNVFPTAVAEQIGSGNWTAATAPTSNPFTITLPSGTTNYGIAYVCPAGSNFLTANYEYVIEATVQDGVSYTVTCLGDLPTGTVTGTVVASGIPNVSQVDIDGVLSKTTVNSNSGAISGSLSLATKDIGVVARDSSYTVLGLQIFRNQTVPGAVNSGSTITLTSADAPPSTQSVSLTNIPSGYNQSGSNTSYYTANGTSFLVSSATGSQYAVVPSSATQSGDFYGFLGIASTTLSVPPNYISQFVSILQTSPTPGQVTLSFPAGINITPPTPAALPTFQFTYAGFVGEPAISDYVQIQWFVSSRLVYNLILTATSSFQNGATSLTVPDFSSITGFYPNPTSGEQIQWQTGVYGGSYHWFTQTPATGSLSWAVNMALYTVP